MFTNPLLMIVLALGIFTAGGLADHYTIARAQLESAQLETQTLRADVEKNRADANQATIDGIQAAVAETLAAETALRAEQAQRERRFTAFLGALEHVVDSKLCTSSPAFRVLINSVRDEAARSHK